MFTEKFLVTHLNYIDLFKKHGHFPGEWHPVLVTDDFKEASEKASEEGLTVLDVHNMPTETLPLIYKLHEVSESTHNTYFKRKCSSKNIRKKIRLKRVGRRK